MYQTLKQFDISRSSVVSAPIIAQLDLWEPSGDKLDEAEYTLKKDVVQLETHKSQEGHNEPYRNCMW